MRSVLLFIALIAVASAWRIRSFQNLAFNTTTCPANPDSDVINNSPTGQCVTFNQFGIDCASGTANYKSLKAVDVSLTGSFTLCGTTGFNNTGCASVIYYTSNDCTTGGTTAALIPFTGTCGCTNCANVGTAANKATCSIWTASASSIASGVAVIALLVAALL